MAGYYFCAPFPSSADIQKITVLSLFLSVCVCVGGGHVYVVYEDTNLYNDMGMTQVLQGEGDL